MIPRDPTLSSLAGLLTMAKKSQKYVVKKSPTRRWDLFEELPIDHLGNIGLKRVDRGGYSLREIREKANSLLQAGHTVETPDEWGDAPDGH